MRLLTSIHVKEETARQHALHQIGRFYSGWREIEMVVGDRNFVRLKALCREYAARGEKFGSWSNIRFEYSSSELESAERLTLYVTRRFDPCGEECGTEYDDAKGCQNVISPGGVLHFGSFWGDVTYPPAICGYGSERKGPLRIRPSSVPKTADFAESIAGEIVVTERVKVGIESMGCRGVSFETVGTFRRPARSPRPLFAMVVTGGLVRYHPSMFWGKMPELTPSRPSPCPMGHLIPGSPTSETCVVREDLTGEAFQRSFQMSGYRQGLLRPQAETFVTPEVRRLALQEGWKGVEFTVALVK